MTSFQTSPNALDSSSGGRIPELSGFITTGYDTVGYWVGINALANPRLGTPETTTTVVQGMFQIAGWDAGKIGLNAPLIAGS